MANNRKEGREELLTTSEAADALGVSPTSIKRWADAGRLPASKTAGGHRRYRLEDIALFLRPEDEHDEPQALLDASPEPPPAPAPAPKDGAVEGGAGERAVVRRLGRMGRAEIDALPIGVIQLSDDGEVLLYSATESRFSGIARSAAEGTHFFGELAPCCNNRLVHGRFKRGVESGRLDVQFDYTFTYRMKPTNVRLHLFRDPETRTNWLTVSPR